MEASHMEKDSIITCAEMNTIEVVAEIDNQSLTTRELTKSRR
jgi:hypothetical protein